MGTIYENIISLCNEANIKGGKMCVDLGISKSFMTKLKDGTKKKINSDTAQKIADYFGVSIDRVLSDEQKEKPGQIALAGAAPLKCPGVGQSRQVSYRMRYCSLSFS